MIQTNIVVSPATDAFAKTARLRIGVDVGGTKIEGVLVDADEHALRGGVGVRVLDSVRVPARRGERQVVEDVSTVVNAMMHSEAALHVSDDNDSGMSRFVGVGIGTPGRVDSAAGVVENIANLDVSRLDISNEIGAACGLSVRVENDVNAAALGAYALIGGNNHIGHGAGISDDADDTVAFLNLGTGLAAGILRNGRLDHGSSGVVGEIGHIPVERHRWQCPCGQRGCLETAAGGGAIIRQWPQANPPMPDVLAKASDPSSPDYELAVGVKQTVIGAIADAIDILAVTVDPRVIMIGGGTARTGEPLMSAIQEELCRREKNSRFIESLHLCDRLFLVPGTEPVGAIGAALSA
ncbi:ROK family protein [Bifidobacterium tissieri]|uniref:ROK family protein n=1 Tax=Bifidobacterium tissieri TaxID=1630162 RepID=A0A5M9ZRF6_9BIFI|nr:ROK family protein [Bifidobacterium tissieri]KAA8829893.1 ROK family protein [Bifidobacterium tissieri]